MIFTELQISDQDNTERIIECFRKMAEFQEHEITPSSSQNRVNIAAEFTPIGLIR